MPKIVERLPEDIVRDWDKIPYNMSCPDQGYFYNEDEDECDNCGNELEGGSCYHCN